MKPKAKRPIVKPKAKVRPRPAVVPRRTTPIVTTPPPAPVTTPATARTSSKSSFPWLVLVLIALAVAVVLFLFGRRRRATMSDAQRRLREQRRMMKRDRRERWAQKVTPGPEENAADGDPDAPTFARSYVEWLEKK